MNIKFTYEVEHNGKIFLLMRSNGKLETTVSCKETNNVYIYIGGCLLLYMEKWYIKGIS